MINPKRVSLLVIVAGLLLVIGQSASAQCLVNPTGETAVGLKNESSHVLSFFIDGASQGEVSPGDRSLDFPVSPGLHTLRTSAIIRGETVFASRDVIVPLGYVCAWTVTSPPATLLSAQGRRLHAVAGPARASVTYLVLPRTRARKSL